MNLVEVVILLGAQCLSPMETGPGLTVVGKVPCAVLIRQDPRTADIDIVPAAAATDPDVVAMLVKPHALEAAGAAANLAAAGDITGSSTPAPRIVPASAEVDAADLAPIKARPAATREKAESGKRPIALARRSDLCGTSRAVWYTNKQGRRKYRCAKAG